MSSLAQALPDEILSVIFRALEKPPIFIMDVLNDKLAARHNIPTLLDCRPVTSNITLVCRQWLPAARQELYRDIDIRNVVELAALWRTARQLNPDLMKLLRGLIISQHCDASHPAAIDIALRDIVKRAPNLRFLSCSYQRLQRVSKLLFQPSFQLRTLYIVSDSTSHPPDSPTPLTHYAETLRELHLDGKPSELLSLCPPLHNLEKLVLDNFSSLGYCPVADTFKIVTNLKTLEIRNRVTGLVWRPLYLLELLRELLKIVGQSLEHLKLHAIPFGRSWKEYGPLLPRLKSFVSLDDQSGYDIMTLQRAALPSTLEFLHVECDFHIADALVFFKAFQDPEFLPSLTWLPVLKGSNGLISEDLGHTSQLVEEQEKALAALRQRGTFDVDAELECVEKDSLWDPGLADTLYAGYLKLRDEHYMCYDEEDAWSGALEM